MKCPECGKDLGEGSKTDMICILDGFVLIQDMI